MKQKNKDKIKGLFTGVVKGVLNIADNTFLGGTIQNITENMEPAGGKPSGRIDYGKLIKITISSTIPVILLIALLFGKIDLETLKTLIKVF